MMMQTMTTTVTPRRRLSGQTRRQLFRNAGETSSGKSETGAKKGSMGIRNALGISPESFLVNQKQPNGE